MITHSFGSCIVLFWMVGNVLFFLFTDLAQREYDRQMLHFESLGEFASLTVEISEIARRRLVRSDDSH